MGLVIGGDSAWKVVSKGEVGLAYHWVGDEPAMVLFPTNKQLRVIGAMPFVLPLSSAHELVKDGTDGQIVDGDVLWSKARTAAQVMGFGDDPFAARKVADLILNGLDDLCDMPPTPAILAARKQDAPTGELAVTVDGETVYQGEA